ncbi:hypothetical protein P8452_17413 [Trifolium repens]|nr:hypothetical protein P8452_17413 [Trifolium repens]
MQRKNAKGKGKVKNESKEPTQTPIAGTDAPGGSQNEVNQTPHGGQNAAGTDAPEATNAFEASQSQAAEAPDAPHGSQSQAAEAPDAVDASQVSMVVEPSQDLFDDMPDEVIATLP